MPRARNIKPQFFTDGALSKMDPYARLLFAALWCLADREGRLKDDVDDISLFALPRDDADVNALLDTLSVKFITRYEVYGIRYIQINNFSKHQNPHHKEEASQIPAPPGRPQVTRESYDVSIELRNSVFERDGNTCLRCGTTDNLSIDHITPLSRGGDNGIDNLQTLCSKCNNAKGTANKDYRCANHGSTLEQCSANDGGSCPTDSLIPDSSYLIPDSLGVTDVAAQARQAQPKVEPNRKSSRTPFYPPSVEEVTAYCQERKNSVNAQRFIDYYATRGWSLKGGQRMKDWRAAVRTWEGNDYPSGPGSGTPAAPSKADGFAALAEKYRREAQHGSG